MTKLRKMKEYKCEQCKQAFSARADHKYRFCSLKCHGAHLSQKNGKFASCITCGNTFKKRRTTSKFCSVECATQARTKKVSLSCDECGKELQKPPCHVTKNNFCSKACLWKWNSRNRVGENSFRWSGGRFDQQGYTFITTEYGRVAEHRFIMEQHLGRPLTSDEIVHHINGDKKDNRIENLEIVTRSEHIGIHRDGLYDSHQEARNFGKQELEVWVTP